MPYEIQKKSDTNWVVVKKDDGKVMGSHTSEAKAKAQLVAIHMNENK